MKAFFGRPERQQVAKLALLAALATICAAQLRANLQLLQRMAFFGHDLGIFGQSIYSAGHGGLLRNSIETYMLCVVGGGNLAATLLAENGGISHLASHWSPILFVLGPIYRLLPDPLTLQAIQVLALALGSLPLLLMARDRLGGNLLPTLLAVAFLVQPLVVGVALTEFHETALAVPVLALLFRCAQPEVRERWFFVALAASLLIKEDVALVVFLFGIGLLLARRPRRGAPAALLGALTLVVSQVVARRCRHGFPSSHLWRYARFGRTPAGIVGGILRHPVRVLQLLHQRVPPGYLLLLLGPWLFLPLLSPYVLLAAPILVGNLLSRMSVQHVAISRFNTAAAPILAVAAVDGLARLRRWLAGWRWEWLARHRAKLVTPAALAVGLGCCVCATAALLPSLPSLRPTSPLTEEEQRGAHALVEQIPRSSRVLASLRFLPFLTTHRSAVPPFELPGFRPSHALLMVKDPLLWPFGRVEERDRFLADKLRGARVVGRSGRVVLLRF